MKVMEAEEAVVRKGRGLRILEIRMRHSQVTHVFGCDDSCIYHWDADGRCCGLTMCRDWMDMHDDDEVLAHAGANRCSTWPRQEELDLV